MNDIHMRGHAHGEDIHGMRYTWRGHTRGEGIYMERTYTWRDRHMGDILMRGHAHGMRTGTYT